jgi:hypothetical protein
MEVRVLAGGALRFVVAEIEKLRKDLARASEWRYKVGTYDEALEETTGSVPPSIASTP